MLGYAKCGKTSLIEALTRIATASGMSVDVLKCGRRHPHVETTDTRRIHRPDTDRVRRAGARHVWFWSESGLELDGESVTGVGPLPPRDAFSVSWEAAMDVGDDRNGSRSASDLLIIEGRPAGRGLTVHIAPDGRYKYTPEQGHLVINEALNPLRGTHLKRHAELVLRTLEGNP